MTKQQELAKKLDGREIGEEITSQECKQAKEDGLIVVFGASDDLCEFRGAFEEELCAYDGNTFFWNGKGFSSEDQDIDGGEFCHTCGNACSYCNPPLNKTFWIKQEWCPKGYEGSWRFTTNIPNVVEFKMYKDGKLFGNGLVINVEDLR